MRGRQIILSCSILFISYTSFAQSDYTLDRDFSLPYQPFLNSKECTVFTDIMPYDRQQLNALQKKDSIKGFKDLLFKKDGPLIGNDSGFGITILPLAGGSAGYDMYGHKAVYDYFGGIHADGNLGRKVSYSASYVAGNVNAPAYTDSLIKYSHVVPGLGYAYGNASSGYSYDYLDAYLSYSPNDIFNFQAGKGKQFFGEGYRSLFLSDASNSYPYLKITTTLWHIKYVNLYTVMRDIESPDGLHKDWHLKYGSFQYLSWDVSKRLNFGFFESIIFKGPQYNDMRTFDPAYLNPVIFLRPLEFANGSPDNALVGFSGRLKVGRYTKFYGQLMLDEFVLHEILARKGWWANKQGVQAGFKQFELFGVHGLSFQTELNYVRPYTYSHGNPLQNYSNFGQPLAHPEGANFIESVSFLTYTHKNLVLEGKLVLTHYGADSGVSDWGHNIFISYDNREYDYGNSVGQGVSTYLAIAGLRAAYIISPKIDLKAELGAEERVEKYLNGHTSFPYVYIGFRTSLGNLYNDF